MKVVILAGGLGTRISEESVYKPKPMIEIGNMPILWHIMKEYSYYGFHDFVICAGYKQHMIKEWFADYFLHTSDITFDFTRGQNEMIVHNHHTEPWKVTVVDTGLNTMTGGRIKRIRPYIGNETFMMTYGDGVCDVDIAPFSRSSRRAFWILPRIILSVLSVKRRPVTARLSTRAIWCWSRRFSTIWTATPASLSRSRCRSWPRRAS